MKKLFKLVFISLFTVSLGSYLTALHSNLWEQKYEICKAGLILQNNYQSNEQAFECVEQAASIKILGTLLFREGTILK